MVVLKVSYKGKSCIFPVKLASYQCSEDNRVKDSAAVCAIIYSAIEENEIVPDEFAEVEGAENIYQLVNISSDKPYLKAQYDGAPAVEHYLADLMYLEPIYIGWKYDPCHELELDRSAVRKANPDYSYFITSIKDGLNTLSSPKWTTTTRNVCRKYGYKPLKYLSLSTTKFWAHCQASLQRVFDNLIPGYYVFAILAEPPDISSISRLWRTEWQSLQFVFLLALILDTNNQFLLSKTYQKSAHIAPYSVTYNIRKAKSYLDQNINHLQVLGEIIQRYKENQFDFDYVIDVEIRAKVTLPTTLEHIHDFIAFKFNDHTLFDKNIFSSFYTQSSLAEFDTNQHLTQSERESAIEDESDQEPDADSGIDTSSDYDPETDLRAAAGLDDEQQEILREYESRLRASNSSNSHYNNDHDGNLHLSSCSAACGDIDGGTGWIECDCCPGWQCFHHIKQEFDIDLDEMEEDDLKQFVFQCSLRNQLLIDTVKVQQRYLESFRDKYFGREGVKSEKILKASNDNHWHGLSIDILLDHANTQKFDKQNMKQNMLKSEDVLSEGLDEFTALYRKYRKKCPGTKWGVLFQANNDVVITAFLFVKQAMIRYIIRECNQYLDFGTRKISPKKLKLFKKNMFFHFYHRFVCTYKGFMEFGGC